MTIQNMCESGRDSVTDSAAAVRAVSPALLTFQFPAQGFHFSVAAACWSVSHQH